MEARRKNSKFKILITIHHWIGFNFCHQAIKCAVYSLLCFHCQIVPDPEGAQKYFKQCQNNN